MTTIRYRESLANRRGSAKRARKRHDSGFERLKGVALGKIFSVDGTIDAPRKPGYVWVHEWGMDESQAQAFNENIIIKADDWVWMARDPKDPHLWQILKLWTGGQNPANFALIAKHMVAAHATNHQGADETDLGEDFVKIFRPALQELKTTGDATTLTVTTQAHIYTYGNSRKEFLGVNTDLTALLPAAGNAVKLLLYLDEISNTILIVAGAEVVDLPAVPVPYPALPENGRASAFVKLVDGQTTVTTASDIEDARDTLKGNINYIPPPTAIGQVLYSVDGLVFTSETPLTSPNGWLVNADGILLVA